MFFHGHTFQNVELTLDEETNTSNRNDGKVKWNILKYSVVATLRRHGNAFTYFSMFVYMFEYV